MQPRTTTHLAVAALVGVTLCAPTVGAQAVGAEAPAICYACTWIHGVLSVPDTLRERVAADRSITDLMEQALLGRRSAPPTFQKDIALWWLAESGRAEYVPTLLRFSREVGDRPVLHAALYGLTRQAGHPDVRARLLELDATASPEIRGWMVGLLALVRDSAAQDVLRAVRRDRLPRAMVQQLERALAATPRAGGPGRVPCFARERAANPRACDA